MRFSSLSFETFSQLYVPSQIHIVIFVKGYTLEIGVEETIYGISGYICRRDSIGMVNQHFSE